MDIDWFTFLAQIVNFLLLVALLRWLLYDRIIHAMDERERKIAGRLEEADQRKADADARAEQYEQQLAQIEQQRELELKQARNDAREEYDRLVREAREEVERRRKQWDEAWSREREDLTIALREQAGCAGTQVARHTLAQLANVELEQRMCDSLCERIRQLDQQEREEISHHLGDGATRITVQSAFDLPMAQRQQIRDAIAEVFHSNAEIDFETARDLICGFELSVGGFSFGWNSKEMLDDIKHRFDQQLKSLKE